MVPRIRNDVLLLCAAAAVIAVYLLPLVILGEDSHVLIHDNLDSHVAYYRVLAESGQVFSGIDSTIPNIMGDLSRNIYPSDLSLITWLHMLLPPFQAYAVNQILLHFLAFFGMYLLLRRHFLRDDKDKAIAIGCSLAFALLPFYPFGGLSVAGQPLALYAFLNIRNRSGSWKDWLILLLVPFYSSIVLAFAFFLAAMGLLWLYDLAVRRKANIVFILSVISMGLVFLLVEYRLVHLMFFDGSFESLRSAWAVTGYGLGQALSVSLQNFVFGQYHAASLQHLFVGLSVAIALPVILYKRTLSADRLLIILLMITGIISLWYGFWGWEGWMPLKERVDLFRTFQFSRFHFLHPLLWYLVFALALRKIAQSIRWGKAIVLVLLIAQCVFCFSSSDLASVRASGGPTYAQFYSVSLFREIKDYIGEDQASYRVASIGLHPSISQYNGFYTVDGYMVNYPLEYKIRFREIIATELEKSPSSAAYFDDWGLRAYIFVAGFMVTRDKTYVIEDLQLNMDAFTQLGGRYIFSTVLINNAYENDLVLEGEFTHAESVWRIYLYKVQHPDQE